MKRFFTRLIAIGVQIIFFAFGTAEAADPGQATRAQRSNMPVAESPEKYDYERARKVIEAHGYDHIRGLSQDRAGVWRGFASRYGKEVSVEVDQQGNFYD